MGGNAAELTLNANNQAAINALPTTTPDEGAGTPTPPAE
jgi:hypothetical protein